MFSVSPSYPPIVINSKKVNIVTHVKLLGVTISNDLKWNVNLHVNAVCKEAFKSLYPLRLLKRNALPDSVLVKSIAVRYTYPSLNMHAKRVRVAQQPPCVP